ncbi:MAG TPA: pyridoxamine 5'-phosphate oxidase family protein [Microlunatus sp.]
MIMNASSTSQPGERPAWVKPRSRRGPDFDELDRYQCHLVLAAEAVGRVGWASSSGQIIVPVNYVFLDSSIGFRTSSDSVLAELIRPTPVAFEVDHLDPQHLTAESVIIQGMSHLGAFDESSMPEWSNLVVPWAGGERRVSIEIDVQEISGRGISRTSTR